MLSLVMGTYQVAGPLLCSEQTQCTQSTVCHSIVAGFNRVSLHETDSWVGVVLTKCGEQYSTFALSNLHCEQINKKKQ